MPTPVPTAADSPAEPPAGTRADASLIDSRTAAWRLLVVVLLVTLGNSSMYVVSVVLPAVQSEFGIGRAHASLPYTAMMICLGLGGLWTGKWADRWGIARVLWMGAAAVGAGYALAAASGNVWMFGLAHGLLGLLGGASTFAPLMADTGLWWNKRRGVAMAVCASGNYLAGTLWPPLVQWGITHYGWRPTYLALGLFCGLGMALLAFAMRRPSPALQTGLPAAKAAPRATPWPADRPFGLRPAHAQALVCLAGVACCVAMSMPQVHIVAYCTDLGFGPARGAEMLSLMLFAGIISRLVSGWICDHIGGVRTLLLGSALQGVALLMFLPASGMMSLYAVSAMFGLFQGGIVPAYAIIVREHFPAREAGARTGAAIMATLIGMALGGWMSGWVFDLTGSYRAAFLNGIAWNLLNLSIVGWLYWRTRALGLARVGAA
ncbi:MAG: MFS transporter [Ottowia sp.]|nr:MFS transporter [Ottowia sp.]